MPLADIATRVMLGHSLREQGIVEVMAPEKEKWYVKAPAFSFSKLRGMDAYLSPEMKSTGEAIGYDKRLTRALYKAMQSSGMNVANYGTIFVTIADSDKAEALPLIRRFYDMGFNIEATRGTAEFLKANGIRTRVRKKLSEGSEEILDSLPAGTRQLRHQHPRACQPGPRQRRRADSPLRGGEQCDHVHRAGHGAGAPGGAGGNHAVHLHHRLVREADRCVL